MSLEEWLIGFATSHEVWATILSVSAGFVGIAVTLAVQRLHELDLEKAREGRARARVLIAFRTEMKSVIEYAEFGIQHLDSEQDFLFPKRAPFPLFDALADKIDLLTNEEIEKVVGVYVWLREIPQRLSLLVEDKSTGAEFYIAVPRTRLNIVQFLFTHLKKLALEAEAVLAGGLND
jgi:hypothetical protein